MNPRLNQELDFNLHNFWMDQAIAHAHQAGSQGEIPVGAIIIDANHQVLAATENRKERDFDPTAHAEILAIRTATQTLQSWHLDQTTLYVTLEPCPMCTGAILQARITTLVYGATDPKTGAIHTAINLPHSPASFHSLQAIAGIREPQCQNLLQTWFQKHRTRSNSDLPLNL
jgi:tRNA(adenine34) deaminase